MFLIISALVGETNKLRINKLAEKKIKHILPHRAQCTWQFIVCDKLR